MITKLVILWIWTDLIVFISFRIVYIVVPSVVIILLRIDNWWLLHKAILRMTPFLYWECQCWFIIIVKAIRISSYRNLNIIFSFRILLLHLVLFGIFIIVIIINQRLILKHAFIRQSQSCLMSEDHWLLNNVVIIMIWMLCLKNHQRRFIFL